MLNNPDEGWRNARGDLGNLGWIFVQNVVSELLTGKTLRERMREESIPVRKVVEYSLQIARGH